MGLFLISLASATSIGTIKQGDSIELIQTCASCTYNNVTTIIFPDGTITTLNVEMDKDGSFYNYTYDDATALGEYLVNGIGDVGAVNTTWVYSFNVSPSGQSGNENTIFSIFIILFIVGLNLLFFFNKNIPLTILTGMIAMFLGVYLVTQGIIIYRDNLTNYIAYVVGGIGFITAIWAALEQFDVL